MAEGARSLFQASFIRALTALMRAPLIWLNCLPKAPPSHPIILGVIFTTKGIQKYSDYSTPGSHSYLFVFSYVWIWKSLENIALANKVTQATYFPITPIIIPVERASWYFKVKIMCTQLAALTVMLLPKWGNQSLIKGAYTLSKGEGEKGTWIETT